MAAKDLDALVSQEMVFEEKKAATTNSMDFGFRQNPDQYAQALKISKETGAEPQAVIKNKDLFEQRTRLQMFPADDLVRNSPRTADFLADQNNAAVAQDDVPVLQRVENAFGAFKQGIEKGSLQDDIGGLHYKAFLGTITADEEVRRKELKAKMAGLDKAPEKNDSAVAYFLNQTGYTGRQIVSSIREGAKGGAPTALAAAGIATIAGQAGPQAAVPEEIVTVPSAAAFGFRAGYITSSTVYNYKMEAGFAFDEFSDIKDENGKPLSRDIIAGAAATVGLLNAGLETVGDMAMLKLFPAADKVLSMGSKEAVKQLLARPTFRAALADAGKRWAKASTAEGITEALQEVAVILGREASQAFSGQTFAPDNITDDVKRVGMAGFDAFLGSAGVGAAPSAYRGYRNVQEVRQANLNAEVISALGETASESKTRARLPEKFRELVESVTADGPVQNIYIPADKFQTFFQSQNIDPAQIAEESGAINYTEALAAGTDVVIPVGSYAEKLAHTQFHAGLSGDIRLRQGDMTANEFATYQADREQRDAEVMAQAQAAAGEIQTDALQRIKNDMLGQLIATGYERSTADAYATVYAKTMKNLAERAGQDPMALHEQYGLTVNRPLPDVLTKDTKSDIQLDPLFDRLRSGDMPSDEQIFGKSLVEFIREKGGMQPAGELLDADFQNRPFQKNLVQKTGMSADQAAEAAVLAGYFPELDASTITERDIYDALDDELRGNQARYAAGNLNQNLLNLREGLNQLYAYLESLGIDINAITDNAEVRRLINEASQIPELQDAANQLYQTALNYINQLRAQGQSEANAVRAQYQNTDQWMRAPNGNPTNLDERQWIQVRTPSFKAWFGDWEAAIANGGVWNDTTNSVSKAVDENGEPKVFFHGTSNGGFAVFNQPSGQQRGDIGIFTTDDKGMAFTYVRRGRGQTLELKAEYTEQELKDLYGIEISEYQGGWVADNSDGQAVVDELPTKEEVIAQASLAVQDMPRLREQSTGVYEVFLNIRDPYEDDFQGAVWNGERQEQYVVVDEEGVQQLDTRGNEYFSQADAEAFAEQKGEGFNVEPAPDHWNSTDGIVREARSMRNDGAFIYNVIDDGGGSSYYSGEPANVYVAFNQNQLKSATDNLGTFLPNDANILFQGEQPFDQTQTEAFRAWSNNAPLIRSEDAEAHDFKTGEKIVVEAFHGTKRPDRVGEKFLKKRATSGPMAFHTSSPELASSYAQGKQDTSLAYEDTMYENWYKFKAKGMRTAVSIDRAWYRLTPEQKQTVAERMPDIRFDDDYNIIYEQGGGDIGSYEWNLKQTQTYYDRMGNPLKAAVETWMTSGSLFGQEEQFAKVLELAGMPMQDVNYDAPNLEFPFVYKNYIAMSNPLVTSDIPQDVIDALQAAAKRDRSRPAGGGADMWDKNTRTLKEWVATYLDPENESKSYVWTSIPDKVTAVFKSLGYDGIVDYSGKGGTGLIVAPVYIPFEENQVKSAIGNKGTFSSDTNNILKQGDQLADKRGFIQFGKDRKFNIALLEKANLSTFLHESGHFYLEVLGDLASAENATDQIKADYAAILKFVGLESRDQLSLDGKEVGSPEYNRAVEAHEMFARANEAYLMEGKAPSEELRTIFQRFKSWLTMIYKQLSALNVELTDQVREVFDRIYATDEEITAAKEQVSLDPMFLTAAEAGMTEAEFAAYKETVVNATESGKEALTQKLMKELQREKQEWWKKASAEMRKEVEVEVDLTPVYAAFKALVDGKVGDEPVKLNKQAIIDKYGKDYFNRLPRLFNRVYTVKGGMDADSAAEFLGFESGDALVEALVSMKPRDQYVKAEVDRRMRETYGDMMTDGTIADEAKIALHNSQRENVLMAELRALRRKQREVRPFVRVEREQARQQMRQAQGEREYERRWMDAERNTERANARQAANDVPPSKTFRDAAQALISGTAIRNLEPYRYLQAQRRAAKEAFAAMSKGDYTLAAAAKQKELLNHHLYLEATKAREEADAILKYAQKFDKASTRQSIGKAQGTYLEQIDAILDRYEFRRVPLRQLDRRQSLGEWIAAQEAEGQEPSIDARLLDEARQVNYREVSISEMRAVRDAVRNIEHLARLKNKLSTKFEQIEFADAIGEMVASAQNNAKKQKPLPVDPAAQTRLEKAGETATRLDAMLLKVEQIVEWLDGGRVDGPWHTYLWNPIAEAQNAENDLTRVFTQKMTEALEAMPKEQRLSMLDTFDIAGIGRVTRKYIISMALNMGNQENIDKMMRGHGWTMNELEAAFDKLNDADLQFVQQTLDTINELWPQIAELEKRMTGVVPPKVEAQPFTFMRNGQPAMTIKGGYYPLVYDPRQSEQGARQETGNLGQLFEEGYVRATTAKGHTKARTEGFAAPIMLDFEQVVTQHLAKVIKDLTYREAVVAANKILTNREIRRTLQETLGVAYEKQMLPWLRSVVNDRNGGSTQGLSDFSSWMMTARSNVVLAVMGFKATTAIAQITGISQSLDKVKARYIAGALIDFMRHPVQMTREVRELSGEMRNRSDNLDRDIRGRLKQLTGQQSKWAQAQRFGFHGIAIADAMVTVPTWMGAYRQAINEGKSIDVAKLEADAAVRMTQGAGGPKDLSAIQRNNELAKALTMFYSYFNVLYNRMRDMGRDVQDIKDMPRFLSRVFFTVMVPAILGELILGRGPDDDEDPAAWAIRKALLYPLMSIPVLRDVASSIDSGFDYRFSPMASALEKIANAAKATGKLIEGDLEPEQYALRVAEMLGYVFGVAGTAQISATGKYLWRVSEGEENPDNIAELIAYALLGKKKEQ